MLPSILHHCEKVYLFPVLVSSPISQLLLLKLYTGRQMQVGEVPTPFLQCYTIILLSSYFSKKKTPQICYFKLKTVNQLLHCLFCKMSSRITTDLPISQPQQCKIPQTFTLGGSSHSSQERKPNNNLSLSLPWGVQQQ